MGQSIFEQYNDIAGNLVSQLKEVNHYIFPKFDAHDCPIKDGEVIRKVTECKHYIAERIDKIDSKRFTICIVGTFSSGKSTLINSMLGRDLLPKSLDVTTMCPTRIKPLPHETSDEFAKIYYLNTSEIYQLKRDIKRMIVEKIADSLIDPDQKSQLLEQSDQSFLRFLEDLSEKQQSGDHSSIDRNLLGILRRLITNEKQYESKLGKHEELSIHEARKHISDQDLGVFIRWVELYIHTDMIPPDVDITDLPGLSVSNPWHEKVTKEQMALSDSIIFCTLARHAFDSREEEALDKISSALTTISDKTFWVLNQWDLVKDENDKKVVIERFYKEIGKYNISRDKIKLYRASALYGLIAKLYLAQETQTLADYRETIKDIERQYGTLNEQVCKQLLDISEIDLLTENVKEHLDHKIRLATLLEVQNKVISMLKFVHSRVYNTYESEIRILADVLHESKAKDIETQIKHTLEELIEAGKEAVNNIINKINKLEFGYLYAITPEELWNVVNQDYLRKEVNLQQEFLRIMGENKYRKNPIYYEVEYKLLDNINTKIKVRSIETLKEGILKVFDKFEENIRDFKTNVEEIVGTIPEITLFLNRILDGYRQETATIFAGTAGVEVSALDELLNWKGELVVTFRSTYEGQKKRLDTQFDRLNQEFESSYNKRFGFFGEDVITADRMQSLLKSVQSLKAELDGTIHESLKMLEESGGQAVQELIEIAKIHPKDYTDQAKWQDKQTRLVAFLTKHYRPALERFVAQLNQYVNRLVANKLMECREEIEDELRKKLEPKLREHITRRLEDEYAAKENEHKRKRDKLGQLHEPLSETLKNLESLKLRIVI